MLLCSSKAVSLDGSARVEIGKPPQGFRLCRGQSGRVASVSCKQGGHASGCTSGMCDAHRFSSWSSFVVVTAACPPYAPSPCRPNARRPSPCPFSLVFPCPRASARRSRVSASFPCPASQPVPPVPPFPFVLPFPLVPPLCPLVPLCPSSVPLAPRARLRQRVVIAHVSDPATTGCRCSWFVPWSPPGPQSP